MDIGTAFTAYVNGGMFLHSLFKREFSKWFLRITQVLGILFAAIVLLTPAKIYSHTVEPYQIITVLSCIYGIYVMVLAWVRKREGAVLFMTWKELPIR